MENNQENFHVKLKSKIDAFVHLVYKLTRKFPREELYGITSQLRRAALSVALNYIEGYARGRNKVNVQFLDISYGSLKECKYILEFSIRENYANKKEEDFNEALSLTNEIGAMLWATLKGINKDPERSRFGR